MIEFFGSRLNREKEEFLFFSFFNFSWLLFFFLLSSFFLFFQSFVVSPKIARNLRRSRLGPHGLRNSSAYYNNPNMLFSRSIFFYIFFFFFLCLSLFLFSFFLSFLLVLVLSLFLFLSLSLVRTSSSYFQSCPKVLRTLSSLLYLSYPTRLLVSC